MEERRLDGGADLGVARTAKLLGLKESEVVTLGLQGRLDDRAESGEPRFKAQDVLRMQAENLIRGLKEETRRDPDLWTRIQALAGIQYQRGMMRGSSDSLDREFARIAANQGRADDKPEGTADAPGSAETEKPS